jgi:hypothetical protein
MNKYELKEITYEDHTQTLLVERESGLVAGWIVWAVSDKGGPISLNEAEAKLRRTVERSHEIRTLIDSGRDLWI